MKTAPTKPTNTTPRGKRAPRTARSAPARVSATFALILAAACGGSVDVDGVSSSGGAPVPASCVDAQGRCASVDLPCEPGTEWVDPTELSCGDPSLACCVPLSQPATCATAQLIALNGGSVTIEGDTTNAPDEHPAIDCGSFQTSGGFNQGQLYYRFQAEAGATYSFQLTTSFYGFLYVFPRSVGCSEPAIQAACGSKGETGMVSSIVNPGSTGTSSFAPIEAQEYVIVVDGDTSPGSFTLIVSES
jgi:hypothetical protein